MKAVFLGYYNNVEDLSYLANKSADEIVAYMKQTYGEFYGVNAELENPDSTLWEFTTDGKYAVAKDIVDNLSELNEDCFIDIMQILV